MEEKKPENEEKIDEKQKGLKSTTNKEEYKVNMGSLILRPLVFLY